jgi:hypothetical protein
MKSISILSVQNFKLSVANYGVYANICIYTCIFILNLVIYVYFYTSFWYIWCLIALILITTSIFAHISILSVQNFKLRVVYHGLFPIMWLFIYIFYLLSGYFYLSYCLVLPLLFLFTIFLSTTSVLQTKLAILIICSQYFIMVCNPIHVR